MKLPNFTSEEQKKFENGVIQVNGKAMNRTALGIIDAYFKLFPKTTFSELKQTFPDNINPSGPKQVNSIFKPHTERDFGVVHSLEDIKIEFTKAGLPYEGLFFLEKEEMFKTSDEVTVIVNKLWESKDTLTGEADLENLAKQALKFGIAVNKFEARKPFGRGSYSLDILQNDLLEKINGTTKINEREVIRDKIIEKKMTPFWAWIILGLALIILILWFAGVFKSDPVTIEKEVINTVVQVDTVYVNKIENIETKFNSVRFSVGSSELPEDAKSALYDLAKVMEKQSNLELKIEGHTSDEGDINHNQQLSEKRAKAVVDFLISIGVNSLRFTFEGKGSSMPIDKNNREINRRTEFIIL